MKGPVSEHFSAVNVLKRRLAGLRQSSIKKIILMTTKRITQVSGALAKKIELR